MERRLIRYNLPRLVWPALAALAAASAVLLYLVDPRVPGAYPPCLFLYFTGCYCPGCGTLRALHRLLHGDILGALDYNPLTVLTLPLLVIAGISGLPQALGHPSPRYFAVPPLLAWALLATVLLFWILRNLPIKPLTMLAP